MLLKEVHGDETFVFTLLLCAWYGLITYKELHVHYNTVVKKGGEKHSFSLCRLSEKDVSIYLFLLAGGYFFPPFFFCEKM